MADVFTIRLILRSVTSCKQSTLLQLQYYSNTYNTIAQALWEWVDVKIR